MGRHRVARQGRTRRPRPQAGPTTTAASSWIRASIRDVPGRCRPRPGQPRSWSITPSCSASIPTQIAQAEGAGRGRPSDRAGRASAIPACTDRGPTLVARLNTAPWVQASPPAVASSTSRRVPGRSWWRGSRLILQMHYNLLNGGAYDSTEVSCGWLRRRTTLPQLHTFLMPAPVELPCLAARPARCATATPSVLDVMRRFGLGAGAGRSPACSCSADGTPGRPRPARCSPARGRSGTDGDPFCRRAHAHARPAPIVLHRADGSSTTVIDIPPGTSTTNVDGADHPSSVGPGDQLDVSCPHDASACATRSRLQQAPPPLRRLGRGLLGRDVPRHPRLHQLARQGFPPSGSSGSAGGWARAAPAAALEVGLPLLEHRLAVLVARIDLLEERRVVVRRERAGRVDSRDPAPGCHLP